MYVNLKFLRIFLTESKLGMPWPIGDFFSALSSHMNFLSCSVRL
ncbi:hypothetical protein OIU74_029207 [Salix koriyanagi]|uniref:Uncharacterized protein n=1 Tax=Salix koriyanagi TaxID=2511006 RepID=A0A9Q0VDG4_9ROSI|nr:hypothetical protein OIU74_029207 [Salix koriyanagi]